ncbi:diketogulonate reductase-like aldo/keto reductase [Dysgonomonas hofstadii]|uniref:Diketogulonate reductase-like aldo/keto reductase n=1 Tax=Dysgonomonas hofstadii TaxID=637886 RepID=A0A840CQI6_9BACT|nr:aldo/keto reductase [Dysgonomonas hofstadii]MBB4036368.1 diketogulonate reductase-like aldo/keto reductase [Dysgonomonas hofstadii]
MEKVKLNNGVEMPWVGLGVFRIEDNKEAERVVKTALSAGYRHIDTAMYYHNEEAVGKAIRESGIPREEIFVTTKMWNADQRSGKVKEAFDASLKRLDTGYIDLYLIHWPVEGKFVDTWKKFEEIYQTGKVKAIGVSNFKQRHLETLLNATDIIPAVNQIELHPYLTQDSDLVFCTGMGIQVGAWSQFAANQTGLFEEKILIDLANKYSKSPAQIILRWDYQRGVVTIPKSANEKRMKENLEIFDFDLAQDEIKAINSLNKDMRIGPDPDHVDF